MLCERQSGSLVAVYQNLAHVDFDGIVIRTQICVFPWLIHHIFQERFEQDMNVMAPEGVSSNES